ncbi:MAG: ABC transporter permease, partial [Sphaerochaetaceae bacterium]
MYRYFLKRLFWLIPVMLGVSIFIFIIMDFFPGDAADTVLGEAASQEQLEEYREAHGLNDPVMVRYVRYMANLLKGDMGISYVTGRDVFKTYMQRLPNTLLLAFSGMTLAILFSIPIGIITALKRGTVLDGTL